MDKGIFSLFDTTALDVQRNMSSFSLAIEGAYSRYYREDPTVRGLRRLLRETAHLPASSEQIALSCLTDYDHRSMLYRTALDVRHPDSVETLQIVAQQLRNVTDSLRLQAARRFKGALVGRHSIAPPSASALRVMNRAGQQFRADEMIYLIARKAAIDTFNESQAMGLLAHGVKIAHVFTKDPEHPLYGVPVLLDGAMSGLPNYAEVQNKWFHPRSNAVLVERV